MTTRSRDNCLEVVREVAMGANVANRAFTASPMASTSTGVGKNMMIPPTTTTGTGEQIVEEDEENDLLHESLKLSDIIIDNSYQSYGG